MHPRRVAAIFLGLSLAIFLVFLLIEPKKQNALEARAATIPCTLGSCPRDISRAENGHALIYGIGTVMTLSADIADADIQCEPGNILDRRMNAYAGRPKVELRALARGRCSLVAPGFRSEIRISRFR